jgi:hypothetical protein
MSDRPEGLGVRVAWHAVSEKVEGVVTHGMLVLPDGEGAHRLYFVGTPMEQAQMLSVMVGYMMQTGLTPAVLAIMRQNEGTDEIRGFGTPQPPPQL